MLVALTEALKKGTLDDDAEELLGRAHQFYLSECPKAPGGVCEGWNVHTWTAEAVRISREILAKRRAAIPAAAPSVVAKSIIGLSDMLLDQGRYTGLDIYLGNLGEIEDLARQALKINRAACPDGDSALIASINKLAFATSESGKYGDSDIRGARFDEARDLFREALSKARAALPSDHPELAVAATNLATQLSVSNGMEEEGNSGLREEIERLYGEALDISKAAFPAGHPTIGVAMVHHAVAVGDMDKIRETLKEVVAMNRAYHPAGHADIGSALNLLFFYGGSE